eukprot:CAMPEP_0206455990 /NCGR_PEP_ID=MMETSP0324_2-20121206/22105_1 /ASSEMBLY_ACC=CAM_ASM_000836 /TAXON_ID=2866 /ORGANISM="Crypthecodinium cohnii, Strain Seligo" /LENGTH=374 /DNA_ID=CAMNT_0053926847 /DNA_START=42 /DNA_END=1163 /DNA_ORIENTATION=+
MTSCPLDFHSQLEACWNLLSEYDTDNHGWKLSGTTENEDGVFWVYHRDGAPGLMEINMRMVLPIPAAMATSFLREWSMKDPPFKGLFSELTSLKSFGPGDTIVCLRLGRRFAAIVDLMMGVKWPDTYGEKMILRMVTRRDFPQSGVTSCCGVAVEATRPIPAWGTVIKAGPESGTVIFHKVWQCPSAPLRILTPLADQFGRIHQISDWDVDPVKYEEDRGFIVVGVRKCSRGPPLVPICPREGKFEPLSEEWFDSLSWEHVQDPQEFNVPMYLRHLLRCAGKEVEVFDSLDGRRLLFYQASTRRCDWLQVWGTWHLFARRHAAAYRRRFGGTGAPSFQGNMEPRFCTELHQTSSNIEDVIEQAKTDQEREEYPW